MAGWRTWDAQTPSPVFSHSLGKIRTRQDSPTVGRVRCWPESRHGNIAGSVHGGFIVAFIDIALTAGSASIRDGDPVHAVTVELNNHFLAPGRIGEAMDAVVEIVSETRGGMVFLRGKVEQGETVVGVFSAIMKKPQVRG